MAFWVATGVITLISMAVLMWAALRARHVAEPAASFDLRVYRDQLKEVDRDVARGVLAPQDAERVRVEVSRRILQADAALSSESPVKSAAGLGLLPLGLGMAMCAAGVFALYIHLGQPGYSDMALADRVALAERIQAERPSQSEAESSIPPSTPTEGAQFQELVKQLRSALSERPNDARGFALLARSEARLGNFANAYKAQERVLELTGGQDAPIQAWVDYVDLLVLAAGGYVSPEAERVISVINARDSQNGVARYYWGMLQFQTGRPDRAFRVWDALLRAGPRDAPWIEPILFQIEEAARLAGVQYQLPTIGVGPSAPRGPTNDDIEAAGEMSPAERMQMIEGMVTGLSERLADEGGPPDDWAQLITSLVVLGRFEDAMSIFKEAQTAFAENPGAMDIINGAADRAGLQ